MSTKKQPEILILVGIPASGKSTFRAEFLAQNPDYVCVSRDDYRYMLRNKGWEPGIEDMVTQLVTQAIITALQNGRSVLADATHCTERAINYYTFFKENYRAKLKYKFFDIDVKTAVERDSKRQRSVGRVVIQKMYADLQAFKETPKYKHITTKSEDAVFEPFEQNKKLQQAVVFDIDGTLAKMKAGGRGPFDWKRVGEDDVVTEVREILFMHMEQRDTIILMSGRDGSCRGETEAWLAKHGIEYDALFMRPAGDMTKDSLVKHKLFKENVLPNYYVKIVYDDRNQVVDMWRQVGLTCFQVAPGDF